MVRAFTPTARRRYSVRAFVISFGRACRLKEVERDKPMTALCG
jgi:hypothetical protein